MLNYIPVRNLRVRSYPMANSYRRMHTVIPIVLRLGEAIGADTHIYRPDDDEAFLFGFFASAIHFQR
jgi:hypothetical protein